MAADDAQVQQVGGQATWPKVVEDHADHFWWCEVQVDDRQRKPYRVRLMRQWRGFSAQVRWVKAFRTQEKADRCVERTMTNLSMKYGLDNWSEAEPPAASGDGGAA